MRKQRRHVVLSAPEVSLTILSSINSLLIDRNWRAGIANSNASGARLILSSGKEFRSFFPKQMADEVDEVKQIQLVDARARNISHNVRCTECGSQSIEDSQADIAILLRKLIRDEIHAGKSDKDIYKKLENEFGETVLYAPKFDRQTAALWLSPLIVAGGAVGVWAYKRRREKTNVHIMALNLVRGVALTPKEKQTMLDILTPPPTRGTTPFSWWKRWQGR